MDETLTELVLRAVELVPPGRLVSYGDVAALVGTGPRQVGAIMAREGHGVPWWRVTNHSGDLPLHLMSEAARLWAAEGIETKPNGRGARMGTHKADLSRLAADFEAATADLAATRDPTVGHGPRPQPGHPSV